MNGQFSTLNEFWPFYVSRHLHPTTRRLHFAGTTLGLLIAAFAAGARSGVLLAAAPVAAYGLAWIGHFFFEKNSPATFKHPLLSLRADFRMYRLMLHNEMDAEILLLTKELRSLRKG